MSESNFGKVSVSWRAVSVTLALLTAATVTTLVVVVATKNVDLLATIALILAIITFVAQLLIFIAQQAVATTQATQSLEINSETKSILTEIRTRSRGAEVILREQVNQLLAHALGGFPLAGDRRPIGASNAGEVAVDNSSEIARTAVTDVFRQGEGDPILQRMLTYPPAAEGLATFHTLRQLSPLAACRIDWYASNEMLIRRIGGQIDGIELVDPSPVSEELAEAGLIEIFVIDGNRRGRLTEYGRDLARLTTPNGEPLPDWLRDANAATLPR
jgi:hypothetical protein